MRPGTFDRKVGVYMDRGYQGEMVQTGIGTEALRWSPPSREVGHDHVFPRFHFCFSALLDSEDQS